MKLKSKLRFLLLIVSLITIVAIPGQLSMAQSGMADVLVTFNQSPGQDEISLVEGLGGTVKTVYHIIPVIAATMPQDNLSALQNDPRVKLVELDTVITAAAMEEVLPWGVDRVDADLLHATNKGTGIKVAVLDTGIDLDHPDLSVTGDVTFVSGTSNGDDDNGHGTKVAGIIAALDNEIGVIGVSPEAALYAVKVLDSNSNAVMSVVLSGLQWAIDNNMQVINMSFGGLLNWPTSVVDALNAAYNAGIVLVAGAGNGGNAQGTGESIWSPARYEPVIAVGATDDQDSRWSSSSTGYTLELMAPGVNIYTTAMGGSYGNMTGTSASGPHAAGVAALLIKSGLTSNVDVRAHMANSATDLGDADWDTLYGRGLVNAYQALNFSEPPDQTPPVTTISLSGTTGNNNWYKSDVTVTLSATDSGGSGVAQTKYSLDTGQTWNVYTQPFTITTEGSYILVLARSWDNAGNDEGPVAFKSFKMDKTPPTAVETTNPSEIRRGRPGDMFSIYYTGTASDALSGVEPPFSTILIDEYGVYDQDLGGYLSGGATVEKWCNNGDRDGRVYTFRFTVSDAAGNQTTVDGITTVTHH